MQDILAGEVPIFPMLGTYSYNDMMGKTLAMQIILQAFHVYPSNLSTFLLGGRKNGVQMVMFV